jgi:hypothetical protein
MDARPPAELPPGKMRFSTAPLLNSAQRRLPATPRNFPNDCNHLFDNRNRSIHAFGAAVCLTILGGKMTFQIVGAAVDWAIGRGLDF